MKKVKYINDVKCKCFDNNDIDSLNELIHKVIAAVIIDRINFISFDSSMLIMLIARSNASEIEVFFKLVSHFATQQRTFVINDILIDEDIVMNWLL